MFLLHFRQTKRKRKRNEKKGLIKSSLSYYAKTIGNENCLISLSWEPEAEFKDFEPRLKFKTRLKHG